MAVLASTVDGRPPPPAWDHGSDDSDHDHPLQEPEFVIHAVDDDRRRRRFLAHHGLLPIQHPPPEPADVDDREAARIKRLHAFMLAPQAVLCSWTLFFGSMMIYYATQPENKRPDHRCIWVIVLTAFIMLFALLSMLLSHLGVYVYDKCPGLDYWIQELY